MHFPLKQKLIGFTKDSDSFKNIDISKQVEIPIDNHVGAFSKERKYHIHEGIDLYCIDGDPVYSMTSGKIVSMDWFTGKNVGSEWWNDTQFIMIETDHGTINYGEIIPIPNLKINDFVSEGQLIGHIKTVLSKDKGRPMAMLHIELYKNGTTEPVEWKKGQAKPDELLDLIVLFKHKS